MNIHEIRSAIDSYYQKKMRRCEASDEEKYRIYEMFLEWYPENTDIPDDIDEFGINELREELWEEFCDIHDVNSKTAHFGDHYPNDLDPDEREDYDETIGDMMTKDW